MELRVLPESPLDLCILFEAALNEAHGGPCCLKNVGIFEAGVKDRFCDEHMSSLSCRSFEIC